MARAKDAIAHALANVLGYDWGLYNLADPDLTAAQLFRSGPSGPRPGSLSHQLMRAPHSVIVLDGIERADPPALERLIAGWRSGVILDNAGEGIPTDAAIFLLTSAVAPARLGQIGRDDLSADQRHLACLKILSEEGVPAGLLRCVDAAFCLQGLTMRDLARDMPASPGTAGRRAWAEPDRRWSDRRSSDMRHDLGAWRLGLGVPAPPRRPRPSPRAMPQRRASRASGW